MRVKKGCGTRDKEEIKNEASSMLNFIFDGVNNFASFDIVLAIIT